MANGYYSSSSHYQWYRVPLHIWFFLVILFLVMGLAWYINKESMFEDLRDELKLVLMLSPLLLLLVLHWLSSEDRRTAPFLIPFPDKDSVFRAGGTPWGVGALLIFLFFMISYQSYFREQWFPFGSK